MKYLFLTLLLLPFVLAGCGSNQIDINSASIDELDKITWVGPATAEKIIDARPFDSLEDLDKVSGIGEKKLSDIVEEGLACVDDESSDVVIKNDDTNDNNVVGFSEKSNVQEPSVVVLGEPDLEDEKLVYESKDSEVFGYLPYCFMVFLIVVIAILLLQRF